MRDTTEQDRRLAADAGAGDDAAFAALVGRHRGSLVRFVARRSGRAAMAEDAVQEALVAAHRALRAGDRPEDVRAWLHTIAWRRALDLLRRERDTAPLADGPTTAPGPDDAVLRLEELEQVLLQWQELPRRQRRALALSVMEGRTLAEIADDLDVSPDAAKSLVARSRRTLARRRRSLALVPAGLLERLRDLAVVGTSHEPQLSMVTKVCASACAATLAGGGGAAMLSANAVVGHAPLEHRVVEREDRTPPPQRKRREQAPRPAVTPVATATVAPAAPATATATATAGTTTSATSIARRAEGSAPQVAVTAPAAATDAASSGTSYLKVQGPSPTAPDAVTPKREATTPQPLATAGG